MDRMYIRVGYIAVLVLAILTAPVCAQPGNLGHNPIYPELPQKEYTPDYFLVGEVEIIVNEITKKATLEFDTLQPASAAKVYYGLYIPEQDIKVPQYRRSVIEDQIEESTYHSVEINIGKFEGARYDICNFSENGGVICYRIELFNPDFASSVFYDGRFMVDGDYNIVPCIIEGPFVDLVNANGAVISWETDVTTTAAVEIEGESYSNSESDTHHEIAITGLSPGTEY